MSWRRSSPIQFQRLFFFCYARHRSRPIFFVYDPPRTIKTALSLQRLEFSQIRVKLRLRVTSSVEKRPNWAEKVSYIQFSLCQLSEGGGEGIPPKSRRIHRDITPLLEGLGVVCIRIHGPVAPVAQINSSTRFTVQIPQSPGE